MDRIRKTIILCVVAAVVVLGTSPAMAGPSGENVSVENSRINGYDSEPEDGSQDSGNEKEDEVSLPGEEGDKGYGEEMKTITLSTNSNSGGGDDDGWRVRDICAVAGAGVAAGILLTAGILAVYSGFAKKRKRVLPVQEQHSDETGRDGADDMRALGANAPSGTADLSGPTNPDEPRRSGRGTVGVVHNIGRRRNQQDSYGTSVTPLGIFAVVSDGMGGLSDGEKVSRQAVEGMCQAAGRLGRSARENPLFEMLAETNDQILAMLGPDQIYKSGATLLAVLANHTQFHWVAVGDSRIYLYCGHHLVQMNSEHIYKRQLMLEAVNKKGSFARMSTDPQKDSLISFLGMGPLKYVEGSLRPVDIMPGDRILLMSDGIFNTITERQIVQILESFADASEAAARMEQQVLEAGNPRQDNFTCVILDL